MQKVVTFMSLVLVYGSNQPATAQSAFAILEGVIKDRTGAVLPGTKIEVHSPQSGQRWSAISDASGRYVFPNLTAGPAEIRAEFAGMRPHAQGLSLAPEQRLTLNITLDAAAVSEQVEVTASAELLQPTRATQSATFNSKALTELPSASRNYTHMIVGEAGVNAPLADRTGRGINLATAPGSQEADGSQSLNPSVNGARPTNNSLNINGIDAT